MAKRGASPTAQDKTDYRGVRLSPRENRRLTAYCEARGLSASEVIRSGLNDLLDRARVADPGPVGENEPPPPKHLGDILREAMRAGRDGAAPTDDGEPADGDAAR